MKIPRILLTAGASGSGKTLLTCGILQALTNRGLKVSSFKCGPDYIDPMFHTKVIGTKSRNLDTFFTGKETTRWILAENAKDSDVAVMEGVMGYYDGIGGTTSKASAYELADITDTPAVLIVNCKGMSVSIVPFIKGFLEYKTDSKIRGVILNQMSAMLYPRVKEMVEQELSVKVLGYVPKLSDCVIESRHLGLVLPQEVEGFREKLNKLAGVLEETLDIESLLGMAAEAGELLEELPGEFADVFADSLKNGKIRIGVAMDEAFCFIYEDNLQLLEKMGAEIVPFSPIHDTHLPKDIDGLIFYGGYPELFAEELEQNTSMREEIREAYEKQMPLIAECGGFMYLHEEMEDMQEQFHRGVGIIKGKAFRTPKLSRFGYIYLEQTKGKTFGENPGRLPAHEFHYFDSTACGEAYRAQKPVGKRGWDCIHAEETLMAGFPHLYYYGNLKLPKAFIKKCGEYHEREEEIR